MPSAVIHRAEKCAHGRYVPPNARTRPVEAVGVGASGLRSRIRTARDVGDIGGRGSGRGEESADDVWLAQLGGRDPGGVEDVPGTEAQRKAWAEVTPFNPIILICTPQLVACHDLSGKSCLMRAICCFPTSPVFALRVPSASEHIYLHTSGVFAFRHECT